MLMKHFLFYIYIYIYKKTLCLCVSCLLPLNARENKTEIADKFFPILFSRKRRKIRDKVTKQILNFVRVNQEMNSNC